jgi:RND superfamily putative drug exporter
VSALLPVSLGMIAVVAALGLISLVGHFMQLSFTITNIVTMMGLAVGIDYSLFIVSRFREERKKGLPKAEAIAVTAATANQAIFFSGMTVVLALVSLVVFPLAIFRSMGIGAILVVITAIFASMTLLPAVLSLLGDRINAVRLPFTAKKMASAGNGGFWAALTRLVTRHAVVSVVLTTGVLILALTPFFGKNAGMSGISGLPDDLPAKKGFLVLQSEFHMGMDQPAMIVVDGDIASAPVQAAVAGLKAMLETNDSFAAVNVVPYADKNLAVVYASLAGDPMAKTAIDAVSTVRTDYVPQAFAGSSARALVTGATAGILDFNKTTADYTPWVFAFVLSLSFIILMVAFRSVVIPAKAILMNLLSVGASYGLIVLVFQKGIGASFFGFQTVDVIESWLPLFLFALLFGLSMDYHVFLLSRIREHYLKTGDNTGSVSFGLQSTGRLITGAALIMVAVFGGFALGDMVMFQQMGFGLGVAVFLDATLVRCILVPASMRLLGKYNWYMPKWLNWLPQVSLGEEVPSETRAPAPGRTALPGDMVPVPVPVRVDTEITR